MRIEPINKVNEICFVNIEPMVTNQILIDDEEALEIGLELDLLC